MAGATTRVSEEVLREMCEEVLRGVYGGSGWEGGVFPVARAGERFRMAGGKGEKERVGGPSYSTLVACVALIFLAPHDG